jgi:Photosystem I psaA/psaB protein
MNWLSISKCCRATLLFKLLSFAKQFEESKKGHQTIFDESNIEIFNRPYPTKPGHFSRTLSKGPNTTTWIWNLHADAHDFDSHTSDLEEISRKVFSAHFGQLGLILIWLSGCGTM